MVKDITNPYLSPSRAVVLVRERAKRRQGCIWAELMSAERTIVRSAEVLVLAEGNTDWTDMVRFKRAPRRPRTQARMYVQGWDLGGLLAAQRLGRGRQSQGIAERRMNGEEESDAMIVAMKPANKARRTARRSWWSEASHPRGNRTTQHTPCAVIRRFFLVGANPTQQLSFQLVATKAVYGGNNMVRQANWPSTGGISPLW